MTAKRLISSGSRFEARLGYSRAVVQGHWCFIAGVTGYEYNTMVLPAGIASQASNCYITIRSVLNDAGFAMQDIVRVVHYLPDRDLLGPLQTILADELGAIRPAATMVIAGLIEPEILYEVEVTAYRGE